MTDTTFGFPFAFDEAGGVRASGGDDSIRGRIVQVLFTARGERVNLPEFGCGLFNLLFDPNEDVLAAATEFTVGEALNHWLGDQIVVDSVDVSSDEGMVSIEIGYTTRADLSRQAVRIHFR